MQNRKSILLIALAVFSIVILLAQNNIDKVYALHTFQNTTGAGVQSCDASQANDLIACVNTTDGTVSVYNSNNGALVRTINLSSGAMGSLGASYTVNHIQCSGIICISTSSIGTPSTSVINRAFAYNIATGSIGTISAGVNFTSTLPLNGNYGFEIACDIQCTAWVARGDGAPGTVFIRIYGETNGTLITQPWTFVAQFTTSQSTTTTIGAMDRATFTISGSPYNMLATYVSTGNNFHVYNLGTGTEVCNINLGDSNTNPDIKFGKFGSAEFWYFTDGITGVQKISQTTSSCAISTTYSPAGFFEGNTPVSIAFNTNNGDLYAKASASVYTVNTTSAITTAEYVTSVTSVEYQMVYDSSVDVLAEAINTDNVINFFFFQSTTQQGSTVCIDTGNDGITDVCFVDTNGDGVPDAGPAGALGALRTNANITQLGFNINCAFGIGSCTDQNPKTNGVGLVYFLVLLIISYACLVAIHIKAVQVVRKENVAVMDYLNINPLLLLVVLVVDLGITWQFNWIPDLLFYTIVVILVAGIAGFAIYKKVKGD